MRIGLVGGGNMARAIVAVALRRRIVSAADLLVSEPDESRRDSFAPLGVRAVCDNAAVAAACDLLVLAVKPQVMDAALASLRQAVSPQRPLVISIAAGKRTAAIESQLPPGTRVVRVMPNTPLLVGAGMSVLCAGSHATSQDVEQTRRLLEAGGKTLVLDERHFDAVTAVSGSGPAYFFLLVEALTQAGQRVGLPADAARRLADRTFVGAAKLLAESTSAPAELRRQVISPGGTTAAAIEVLEAAQFAELVASAVAAATARGRELSGS